MMTGTTNNLSEKVTVIGLGSMGAALASSFLIKGFQVTVWNRDQSKAFHLMEKGALLASSLIAAIEASPLLVVCVSDYKATKKIFETEGAVAALRGRILVQLSTGTPKEARDFDTWAHQQGANCLNGDILAWPKQIGSDEATITISGASNIFKQYEATLRALAGTFTYLGEEPGASSALFSAVLAYLAGNWIGFCHGALICENEGLRADELGLLIQGISPILGAESKHMGEVIQHNRFNDPESTVKTTGDDLQLLVQHTEETGISNEFPKFAANLFKRAIDAGYGKEEHAAIIKVMRKHG